jgi:hypothetical protein
VLSTAPSVWRQPLSTTRPTVTVPDHQPTSCAHLVCAPPMHHSLSLPLSHHVEDCEASWQPPKATHDALAPRMHSQGLPRDHAHYRALNGSLGAPSRAASSPLVGCPPQPLECLLSPLCVGSLPLLPLPQPPPPLPKPPSGVKCVCVYKGCVWSACAHKPRATCTPGCNAGHAMGLFQGRKRLSQHCERRRGRRTQGRHTPPHYHA